MNEVEMWKSLIMLGVVCLPVVILFLSSAVASAQPGSCLSPMGQNGSGRG